MSALSLICVCIFLENHLFLISQSHYWPQ